MSTLQICDEDALGCPTHEVWLNTEVAEFDGLCIGVGETRQAAIMDAITDLESRCQAEEVSR